LRPGTRRAAQVDNGHAATDQSVLCIDIDQLEGGARTVAMLLRKLDIRIVQVAGEPRAIDFALLH
jgi:hypothetical protein